MSNNSNNDDSRYDSKTTNDGNVAWVVGDDIHTTTVKDNLTGKEYSHSCYDKSESQRGAWEKAGQDRD